MSPPPLTADGVILTGAGLETAGAIANIVALDEPSGTVSSAPGQTIELRLAETGTELWPAVEAAQYARLIHHDPPESVAEEQAIGRFLEAFAGSAETWEALEPLRRTGLVAGLSAQLDALQRCGLHVHWAVIDGGIGGAGTPVTMPLAVLTISRVDLPTARVQLPGNLELGSEGGGTTH